MFQSIKTRAPKMESRRALLLINMQNDAFGAGDLPMSKKLDMAERAKNVIPTFRKLGEVVWVKTEFLTEQPTKPVRGESSATPTSKLGLVNYFSSSRERVRKRKRENNGDVVDVVTDPFEMDDHDDSIDDYLSKHKEGPPPTVFQPGTRGAQIKDDLQPYIKPSADLVMVKHHHSAFDSTPLLMYLRMKFITHVYLCGYLSNVSIYATAADAVRHGFEVTVVEDVLGYRSEARHIEAMRKMADFLGVSGVDSDEINHEAGQITTPPPDTEEPVFTGPGMEGIVLPNHLTNTFRPQLPPVPQYPSSPSRRAQHAASTSGGATPGNVPSPKSRLQGLDDGTERSTPSAGDQSPELTKRDLGAKDSDRDPNRRYGPGERVGEGDSSIIYDALSGVLADQAFKLVDKESNWQVMHHLRGEVPRRVAVQGEIAEHGSFPVYRHPADESPPLLAFSETVRKIRDELQTLLKQPFNHVLIQLYRSGHDNISEHSDKTLDIVRGSSIINLSLGAQRNMVLRTKKPPKNKRDANTASARQTQRIPMPHNSVFVLGSRTNAKWLHAVRPDKRMDTEKLEAEKAYDGARISLTFRNIGTFVSADQRRIWGQGARSKWRATAGMVSSADSHDMEAMIIAFGHENQQTDFEWDAMYGRGFDVLNLVPVRSTLFLCSDEMANQRVKMCIFSSGLDCRITAEKPPDNYSSGSNNPPGSSSGSSNNSSGTGGRKPHSAGNRRTIFALSGDEAPVLREVDPAFSEIVGDLAILFYLNKLYMPTTEAETDEADALSGTRRKASSSSGASTSAPAPKDPPRARLKILTSNVYARITQANELLFLWQELRGRPLTASTRATHQVRRMSGAPSAAAAPSPASPAAANSSSSSSAAAAAAAAYGYNSASISAPLDAFEDELEVWEEYADDTEFIAGDVYAIVDCAFWPVLDEIVRRWSGWSERRYPNLAEYWKKVGAMESTRQAMMEKGKAAEKNVTMKDG